MGFPTLLALRGLAGKDQARRRIRNRQTARHLELADCRAPQRYLAIRAFQPSFHTVVDPEFKRAANVREAIIHVVRDRGNGGMWLFLPQVLPDASSSRCLR